MTVSTPKPLVVSECCGANMLTIIKDEGTSFWVCASCRRSCNPKTSKTNGLKKQIKDILDEASNANVGSETDESPVESVSQPKAVDGYLKEFDEFFDSKLDAWIKEFPGADSVEFISGFDVAQEIAESFLSSSIERARQEGRKEMMGDILKACSDGKATLTLDIKKMFPEEVK